MDASRRAVILLAVAYGIGGSCFVLLLVVISAVVRYHDNLPFWRPSGAEIAACWEDARSVLRLATDAEARRQHRWVNRSYEAMGTTQPWKGWWCRLRVGGKGCGMTSSSAWHPTPMELMANTLREDEIVWRASGYTLSYSQKCSHSAHCAHCFAHLSPLAAHGLGWRYLCPRCVRVLLSHFLTPRLLSLSPVVPRDVLDVLGRLLVALSLDERYEPGSIEFASDSD